MSWDDFQDVTATLEQLSESTGCSYVLVMAKGGDEGPEGGRRFIVKSCGQFTDGRAVIAIDEALAELMGDACTHYEIEDEEDDD